MTCTCGRIAIGTEITSLRNWNPDCAEHGTQSDWWKSPEQIARRDQMNATLRDLQAQARQARADARVRETGLPKFEAPPDDAPVCPGCAAVAEMRSFPLPGDIIGWRWETAHELDCAWMANPESEPYA